MAPEGRDTRPTSDMIREAIFNALGSIGAVEGARFADLYAGSGAMGIEALSRGAEHCVFVERDRRARDVIHENLISIGLVSRAEVVAADVVNYLATAPAFDVALADPPYANEEWPEMLAALESELLVIESNRHIDLPPKWLAIREKSYGTTVVLVARRATGL